MFHSRLSGFSSEGIIKHGGASEPFSKSFGEDARIGVIVNADTGTVQYLVNAEYAGVVSD